MSKIQIFELFGSILLKDHGVEGQLDKIDKKASGTSKSMGLSFSSIAGAALKLGAIISAGLGINDMIQTAAKGQDRLAQTEAVLKSTGGAAGMTSDAITKLTNAQNGLSLNSKGANRETENLMLTFTKIGKDVFPQTLTTINDMSQALGQDTKSSAIQLGKALQDPIKGITALSRVGVNFTAQQKEQIKAMVAVGDVAGAQKIILAELGTEFGGSALAASKTFDGQMIILKNNMHGIGGIIGNAVLPYLTKFSTWINEHMPQIQQFVTDAMKVIGDALKKVSGFVSANLLPIFKEFYGWIAPHIPQIKQFFTDNFNASLEVFKKVWTFLRENILPIFKEFFEWISPHIPAIRQFIVDAWTKILDAFKIVGDFVKENVIPIFKDLAKWFVDNFPKIKDAVMKAYDYIKPSFDKLVQTVKDSLMPIIMGLFGVVQKAMPGIQAIFAIVFPILVFLVKTIIDGITLFIKVVKGIYDFVKPGLDLVADLFSTIFGGIKKIVEGVQWVIDKFNGTKMKDKNATVTTNYKDTGSTGPLTKSHNAAGTNFWQGGETWVNEVGGEIIDLPTGTRIIPHDVSMAMAKNSSNDNSKGITQHITINSPTALSPSEVARQTRIAMQQFALQF